MDDLWSIKKFARWYFELPDDAEPTKSQQNSINDRCRRGQLPAIKVCGAWRIDVSEILRKVKHENK